jgi:hypothetical protein
MPKLATLPRRLVVALVLVAVPVLAQAECGWLLMVPPLFDKKGNDIPGREAIHRPMAEWIQDSAHDSAAGCEERFRQMISKPRVYPVELSARCLPASQVPVR